MDSFGIVSAVTSADVVGQITQVVTDLFPVLLPLVVLFIGIRLAPQLIRNFAA